MTEKKCKKCGIIKDRDCFYLSATSRGGIAARCKQCLSEQSLNGYYGDQDRRRAVAREYGRKNFKKVRDRLRTNRKFYARHQTQYTRLAKKCRDSIKRFIFYVFQDKYKELIGCSPRQLKVYLTLLFREEMTWENYGEWTIDHKKPLSSFDLTDKDQVLLANHYSNLQPLWGFENDIKASNYSEFHPLGCDLLDDKERLIHSKNARLSIIY